MNEENEEKLENVTNITETESPEALKIKASDEQEENQAAAAYAPEAFAEPEFHIGFVSGNDIHNMGYDNFNAMCFNFALLCFGFAFLKWVAATFEKVIRRIGKDGDK